MNYQLKVSFSENYFFTKQKVSSKKKVSYEKKIKIYDVNFFKEEKSYRLLPFPQNIRALIEASYA